MKGVVKMWWIPLAIVGVIVLWAIASYNGLVQTRNQVKNGWAQIDVQLKRRFDLIPNLVETVKGYAKHEQETFEKVIKARNAAMGASTVEEMAAKEGELRQTLRSLFALSESYPELKANENFLKLQDELSGTENKISFSRQFYNDVVYRYNTRIQSFPTNILAGVFHFTQEPLFEVDDPAERETPQVKF
jgi:LemA protein